MSIVTWTDEFVVGADYFAAGPYDTFAGADGSTFAVGPGLRPAGGGSVDAGWTDPTNPVGHPCVASIEMDFDSWATEEAILAIGFVTPGTPFPQYGIPSGGGLSVQVETSQISGQLAVEMFGSSDTLASFAGGMPTPVGDATAPLTLRLRICGSIVIFSLGALGTTLTMPGPDPDHPIAMNSINGYAEISTDVAAILPTCLPVGFVDSFDETGPVPVVARWSYTIGCPEGTDGGGGAPGTVTSGVSDGSGLDAASGVVRNRRNTGSDGVGLRPGQFA